jgi:hypothetical protein
MKNGDCRIDTQSRGQCTGFKHQETTSFGRSGTADSGAVAAPVVVAVTDFAEVAVTVAGTAEMEEIEFT